MQNVREASRLSVRRLARAFEEAPATVGRWTAGPRVVETISRPERCPVSGDAALRARVRELCHKPRCQTYGHRRIRALLRRQGWPVSRKTVVRIMRELKLSQPKLRYRPARPPRVAKMMPTAPAQAWQIDMTSLRLADLTPLFLVVVVDCFTRQIVGWTLDRRCRAGEWTAALRMGLEACEALTGRERSNLRVRSDNGSQPCSKAFVEFLGQHGVRGEYTGYDAPDDNAFVERVIRTVKEEEIWLNEYDTEREAHAAIEAYVNFYNVERIHSALGYLTPNEFATAHAAGRADLTLAAA